MRSQGRLSVARDVPTGRFHDSGDPHDRVYAKLLARDDPLLLLVTRRGCDQIPLTSTAGPACRILIRRQMATGEKLFSARSANLIAMRHADGPATGCNSTARFCHRALRISAHNTLGVLHAMAGRRAAAFPNGGHPGIVKTNHTRTALGLGGNGAIRYVPALWRFHGRTISSCQFTPDQSRTAAHQMAGFAGQLTGF